MTKQSGNAAEWKKREKRAREAIQVGENWGWSCQGTLDSVELVSLHNQTSSRLTLTPDTHDRPSEFSEVRAIWRMQVGNRLEAAVHPVKIPFHRVSESFSSSDTSRDLYRLHSA